MNPCIRGNLKLFCIVISSYFELICVAYRDDINNSIYLYVSWRKKKPKHIRQNIISISNSLIRRSTKLLPPFNSVYTGCCAYDGDGVKVTFQLFDRTEMMT